MNSHEIEQTVKRMMENFSKKNFLYDLLLAYGISKTSITRFKSTDQSLQKSFHLYHADKIEMRSIHEHLKKNQYVVSN